MPLADAIQVVDYGTLFDQLSLLKNHGFTQDELRAMSPADVSRQYALALREGATAGPPPAEAAELAETRATAVPGVWPQPASPLLQHPTRQSRAKEETFTNSPSPGLSRPFQAKRRPGSRADWICPRLTGRARLGNLPRRESSGRAPLDESGPPQIVRRKARSRTY